MTEATSLPAWKHVTGTLNYLDGRVDYEHISLIPANPANPFVTVSLNKGPSTCGFFKATRRELTKERFIDKCWGLFKTRAKAMRAVEKRLGLPVCPSVRIG